ncbi:MAG: phage tail tape measure protein [Lachnospiraceae bacterium]|nr:phage tail tape measure protein [Lachnospiraceae bacterium]
MGEEFLLDIIALLNQQLSKKKIKEQLKGMDNSMFVKVISKLSIGLSQRQLKKDLKQLNDLYLQVGADLKIDSALKKKLQDRIKTLQDSISDLQIGVHTKDSDIARSVTEARNKGQRVANRTSIDFNIEVKKEKAIADLEYMAKKYSKLFSNASASAKYNNILDAAYGITDAKQLSNVRAQIAAFTSELKANNLASQSLGDKWKRLIDRAKDLFSAASAVTLIFSQVKQAVSSFLQLDTAMTNLYKVQDQITSRDQFSGLLTKWNKLAQNLAVTTESLISSMEAWSKIGFDLDMSEQLAEITSIFEKTAEISNEKATSTLISAAQAFTEIDDYVKRVEAVGDKINAIGNKYAIDSEGIADGLQNASAALKVAGNDLNETIALITATNKIYQNPDEGSNMLKVASMRLRGQVDALKEMGEDAEGVSTDLTKIQQQVYELTGNKVNIFEDDENLKSTYQMILEIGEVFDSLNDRSQADLLEVMFGKQRASAGASLLLNYEELEKIKNDSMNAVNSMAEEYSKYMESASASLTIFKEKLIETYSTFMSGDLIKYTADMGSGLLDLVNATDLLRHGLVGIISLNIGKGITSIGASIASTVKQMNTLGNALQQVKNLPVDEGLRKESLQELGEATKNLTEKNLKLLLSQKQLEETDRIIILGAHDLTQEEAKLKLEKMGLLSATKQQTAANVEEAATTGILKNAMLSLKATAKEVGVTIKGIFASNPIGMGLMLVTTIFSVATTAISKHNEKLEETRRANIESATAASENADKLKDLYNEYNRLASIQDRTTSEEEAFKTAVENITVALGDKAEILKDLTAGTDEYADALARVTKEELQSQAVTATIGRKAAEEDLQGKTWDKWSGSQVTIDSNDKGKSLSDEAQKAVDIVSESLKEYETINRTWKNISWDISSDDPTEALEYYNSLVEAREKLVLASENDELLLDTEIYEDLNTAINSMSESLDTYIEKLYEEEKLNYMAQNGIPSVTEEYKAMESALVSAAGSSVDLQNRFKELLTSDFSDLATDIGNVGDAVNDVSAQAQSAIPLFNQLTSSEEELDKFQSSIKSATEAYSTLLSGNYSSTELLDSIQTINKAVSDMGGSLDWEFINSQTDSLELLGDAIQHISQKYAESILSGAGIDIDSEFGQMLANMITQAFEAEAAFEGMNSQLDNLQSSYQTLTDVLESYNKTGYISLDNLQSLLTADENLIQMLEVENGQLVLNQAAYENLVAVQLLEFKAKLNDAAAAEIETLAKQKAEQATNQNAGAAENAVAKLDAETQAFNRNTSAAIANAVAKAEESGVSAEEIQGVFDKYTEVWNSAMDNYNVDFDSFMSGGKSAASKAGKEHADEYIKAFEKEYSNLKDMLNRGEISEAQYLNRLRALYTRYFKDRKKYLNEYKKYESEYLTGMLDLHNKALSGISTLLNRKISAANDAKDASISALQEEKEAAEEAYQAQIDAIEKEKDAIDDLIKEKNKKIDSINEEIDAIERAAETRKKNIQLEKDQYNLEKMLNNRSSMVYKDGQFIWDTDTRGIRDAREKVREDQEALRIDGLKNEISLIQKEIDLLEEKKDSLSEEQDRIQKLMDESNKYYDNLIKQQEKMWDSIIRGMEQNKSRWEELAEVEEIAKAFSYIQQVFGDLGYTVEDVLNGSDAAFEDFKSHYISLISDVNSNSDFTEGLVYATGVAKENLGSFLDKTKETAEGLDELGGKGSEMDSVTESMDKLSDSATTASTSTGEIASNMGELNTNTEGLSDNLNGIGDALTGIPEADKFDTLTTSFTNLGDAIKGVASALGVGEEGTVGGLVGALQELSGLSLGEEDTGILSQFNNLKTAVEGVTSAISGGGSSGGGKGGDASSSSSASMSAGAGGEGTSGLVGAIEEFKTATDEALGGGSGEGEGSEDGGTGAIPQFKELKTAVDDVTTAIGSGESEGGSSGEEESDNLIGSIVNLGDTTEEEMGESGGDGIIGRFEEFRDVIGEADEHVHSISDGLDAIDGKEVECTITVNVKQNGSAYAEGTVLGSMNLESGEYTAQYGKAFAGGTGKYEGLPKAEKNALVSEYGQTEMTVLPDGKTIITDEPTMMDLPKDTVIYNEEQTKKIMDNKIDASGNAHADGTDDTIWTTLADGSKVRPLQPGDKMWDLYHAFDAYLKSIDGNLEKLVPNSFYEQNREWNKLADQISYANSVVNNRNVQQPVTIQIGDINLTGVQDVNGLAQAIKTRLPGQMMQEYSKN